MTALAFLLELQRSHSAFIQAGIYNGPLLWYRNRAECHTSLLVFRHATGCDVPKMIIAFSERTFRFFCTPVPDDRIFDRTLLLNTMAICLLINPKNAPVGYMTS
jgi:hypothetical protein